MSLIRWVLSIAVVLLLGAGYAASVAAALSGQTADYAQRVDQSPIRNLALLVLLASVALAFVKAPKADKP